MGLNPHHIIITLTSTDCARQVCVEQKISEMSFVSCTTSHVGLRLLLESIEHDDRVMIYRLWVQSPLWKIFYFGKILPALMEKTRIWQKIRNCGDIFNEQETKLCIVQISFTFTQPTANVSRLVYLFLAFFL